MTPFSAFDTRRYLTLPVREGYAEWSSTYEATVLDLMDLRLLDRLRSIRWHDVRRAIDLACGTGRGGAWLRQAGVAALDGLDLTPAMLAMARDKAVYDRLEAADVRNTPLMTGAYDLATMLLADEHLPDLAPTYQEASRLLETGGRFVLVGYHPHFLMAGIAAHFDRVDGRSVAIESYVHQLSDHAREALDAGFALTEMVEAVIDDDWIAAKPKWSIFRHHPVSFAFVWTRT